MTTAISTQTEVINDLKKAVQEMKQLISALAENKINTVPYTDSWTAAQLVNHVTKSIAGLGKAMASAGKPAERAIDERIEGFKTTFLDLSKKMSSPDFIIPESGPYKKQDVINELDTVLDRFSTAAQQADLAEIVEGMPFGPATKLEILHFVLYHTQRHLQQLKKIHAAL